MKPKKNLWAVCLIMMAIVVTVVLVGTRASAARKGQDAARRDQDLAKVFLKHELVKLNTAEVAGQVRATGRISLVGNSTTYDLLLIPNDMRSPHYHAEETGPGGVRRTIESGPVRTYKGSVLGIDGSLARFTIDEKSFEGMILTSTTNYFIEPAQRYSSAAAIDDFVLFDEADLIKSPTISCDVNLSERVNSAIKLFAPRAQAPSVNRVIELATEADAEMVTQFGTTMLANAEILAVMNQVDAVYQRDLQLTFSITFQHGWTTPDPFNPTGGNDQVAFLNAFRDYWNANFPTTNPLYLRDTAHMWTSKAVFFGAGRAKVGVVCLNPTSSYGWSSRFPVAPQKYILPAHEIGHTFNASHVDTAPGCANTVMITTSNDTTQFLFCPFSITEITTFVNANNACLSIQTNKTRFDFDGDGKADKSVFRPTSNYWYFINSGTGGFSAQLFGTQGDISAPEDFDGDGKTDVGVFRPSTGTWYLNRTRDGFLGIQFGTNGDRPVAADFDGDGKADIAVYRPTTGGWYWLNSSTGGFSGILFGTTGDMPAPGDFDGDGKADVAVFRPSTGTWYVQRSRDGFFAMAFGSNGDKPDPADFDGDRKADIAVFRPATGGWYIQQSTAGFSGQLFGTNGDIPIAADYDGDGKADVAVWRPNGGGWYSLNSSNGAFQGGQFGQNGDVPSPSAYVP